MYSPMPLTQRMHAYHFLKAANISCKRTSGNLPLRLKAVIYGYWIGKQRCVGWLGSDGASDLIPLNLS